MDAGTQVPFVSLGDSGQIINLVILPNSKEGSVLSPYGSSFPGTLALDLTSGSLYYLSFSAQAWPTSSTIPRMLSP